MQGTTPLDIEDICSSKVDLHEFAFRHSVYQKHAYMSHDYGSERGTRGCLQAVTGASKMGPVPGIYHDIWDTAATPGLKGALTVAEDGCGL